MKRLTILAAIALMPGLAAPVPAAIVQAAAPALTEATFDIPDMVCGLCPVTVHAAMSKVEGVRSVETDLFTRTAQVVYDPSLTDAAAIAHASEMAGYPASLRE